MADGVRQKGYLLGPGVQPATGHKHFFPSSTLSLSTSEIGLCHTKSIITLRLAERTVGTLRRSRSSLGRVESVRISSHPSVPTREVSGSTLSIWPWAREKGESDACVPQSLAFSQFFRKSKLFVCRVTHECLFYSLPPTHTPPPPENLVLVQ